MKTQKKELDKISTIEFFNSIADQWDNHLHDIDYKVSADIVSNLDVSKNAKILDVGCGTGIMTKTLLEFGYSNIIGVDISEKMIEKYNSRFGNKRGICADFEGFKLIDSDFDIVMIYNAFPHFSQFDKVFSNSRQLLKKGGKLIIAHSMTREELNEIHKNAGIEVENDILISDKDLISLYETYGFEVKKLQNHPNYFICGVLNEKDL